MKKILLILFICISTLLITRYILILIENNEYKDKAEHTISMIETYLSINGYLPDSIQVLGIQESIGKGPYYQKSDSSQYIIYYNIGFDSKYVYNSKSKEWLILP